MRCTVTSFRSDTIVLSTMGRALTSSCSSTGRCLSCTTTSMLCLLAQGTSLLVGNQKMYKKLNTCSTAVCARDLRHHGPTIAASATGREVFCTLLFESAIKELLYLSTDLCKVRDEDGSPLSLDQ
uniref:Uncharacterized protein n=1 Tax=Periophthalmus magnuspinnatus TaxID=409849 RepID=A0A3B3Z996_9GOBI